MYIYISSFDYYPEGLRINLCDFFNVQMLNYMRRFVLQIYINMYNILVLSTVGA